MPATLTRSPYAPPYPAPYRPREADARERLSFPAPHPRKSYHNSCAHLMTVLTPLVIGELIKDPEKRWRWIRIGSVVTALVGEMMWQYRIAQEERDREARSR
jgi:hypothetical protein